MSMTLTHISLFVQDMQVMLKFYRDTMGLQVLGEWGSYAELKASENVKLSLFNRTSMEQTIPLVQASEVNGHRSVIEFRVDQLDEFCNTLRRQRVQFITDPTNYSDWGIRSAYIEDPEGNLVDLYEPLSTQQ
ncbi:MAG TPA: VOC family protein [Ktedonobacteraceae bacterium]|nr:VOC family protein [Ktedonobacteraceae bacterium]